MSNSEPEIDEIVTIILSPEWLDEDLEPSFVRPIEGEGLDSDSDDSSDSGEYLENPIHLSPEQARQWLNEEALEGPTPRPPFGFQLATIWEEDEEVDVEEVASS